MKRLYAFLLVCTVLLPNCLSFSASAEEKNSIFSIDSIMISNNKKELCIDCSIPDGAADSIYYIFKVSPHSESISGLTPVADESSNNGSVSFTVSYNSEDRSSALYGYVLAASDGKSGYTPLTKPKYIDNLHIVSDNKGEYPIINGKKGLEVQYIADAQLLGVSHSVVHVSLNDLITLEASDDSIAFVYGELKYYIKSDALTLLDYRIRTLSDAGIHIYINYILQFDSSAPSSLYFPSAEGDIFTIFAPNISTPENVELFASVIYFLTERYTSGEHGFCRSYIIGYEVNNEAESNAADITSLKSYAEAYGAFLRISYLSATSAYSNARVFVSLSNRWCIPSEETMPCVFGGREFLDELIDVCDDIPFGIAVNPYPSSLSASAYWEDDKATDSVNTPYVTMKNISVLTEYLKSDKLLYDNKPRSVVISEFGVSGSVDEASENVQAAAYAYAYFTATNNSSIEAFIWHRHVDHSSELDLNYGLFSSTDIILDGGEEKLIHKIMSVIDVACDERTKLLNELIPYLPIDSIDELIGNYEATRNVIVTSPLKSTLSSTIWKKVTAFDFSKSLYSFYPTDNSEYIDSVTTDGITFMRVATIPVSSLEYMGVGASINGSNGILSSKYISARIRVNSEIDTADIMILISGNSDGKSVVQRCQSQVQTNEWITVTFPIDALISSELDKCTLKLWVRSDNTQNERTYLDVADICTYTQKNITPIIIVIILLSVAVLTAIIFAIYLLLVRSKRARS